MRTPSPLLALLVGLVQACAQEPTVPPAASHGLGTDPAYFPLAVWTQDPAAAGRYRDLGINTYVGLWDGPTAAQLTALEQAGMRVICQQNAAGLAHAGNAIVAWLQDDEPDNAQPLPDKSYGPPVPPAEVVARYERMRKADPRPVLLNLSQGAAWDGWWGRGVRTDHPEDYAEYLRGCDIASFDIYPVTHKKPEVHGKLEFVGRGVRRLTQWSNGKPVFACIETTHIDNPGARPTAAQVRSEAWIAITCGARGLIWFAHQFEPTFVEAGILHYPEIAEAVRDVNQRVTALAPILNGPAVGGEATVTTDGGEVAILCKRDGADLVVFAASLTPAVVNATFTVLGARPRQRVHVIGEFRHLRHENGRFDDEFQPYAWHHYRITR